MHDFLLVCLFHYLLSKYNNDLEHQSQKPMDQLQAILLQLDKLSKKKIRNRKREKKERDRKERDRKREIEIKKEMKNEGMKERERKKKLTLNSMNPFAFVGFSGAK